ncbi:MAG TPA: hypothetical protein VMU34_14340 [Mycobacterium sp.]|nr:hypothetical protein [Mycobacterium sp.]
MTTVRELAAALAAPKSVAPQPFGLVWGVVSSPVSGPPKTVTLTLFGGSTGITGVRYLSSYTATGGDTVAALAVGPDLLILGKLA